MGCQEVEKVLEETGGMPLPTAARVHLENCGACRNLVGDLQSIVDAARDLPGEVEPPERVWVSLRAQLEVEGIIRTPKLAAQPAASLSPWKALFLRPAFASGGLLALALASYLVWSRHSVTNSPAVAETPTAGVLIRTKSQLNSTENGAVPNLAHADSASGTALRDNLKIVNSFIASCEKTMRADPQDDLTREYLSDAYQQKAELLTAMQDRTATGD